MLHTFNKHVVFRASKSDAFKLEKKLKENNSTGSFINSRIMCSFDTDKTLLFIYQSRNRCVFLIGPALWTTTFSLVLFQGQLSSTHICVSVRYTAYSQMRWNAIQNLHLVSYREQNDWLPYDQIIKWKYSNGFISYEF